MNAELVHERGEVAGPADRDRRRAEQVLENQVPADDPGDELAQRRVAVRVRAAGDRNHRRELRVAEPANRQPKPGEDEREHDGRPRVLRRGRSRQHEDAGADDRADAQQGEVERAERALERVCSPSSGRFALEALDALLGPQAHAHVSAISESVSRLSSIGNAG